MKFFDTAITAEVKALGFTWTSEATIITYVGEESIIEKNHKW